MTENKMANKNQEKDQDAMNYILAGDDIKRWEDWNIIEHKNHVVDSNKLIKYDLRSDPEGKRNISIPLKHAYKAKKLQSLALESENMTQFYEKVSLWPSLKGVYIPDRVVSFVHTKKTASKEQFRIYDKIYLETCLHLIGDELATMNGELTHGRGYRARERYNAVKIHQLLKGALKSL